MEGETAEFQINRTVVTDNRVLVRLRVTERGTGKNFTATLEPNATSVRVRRTTVDRMNASLPGTITVALLNHADYNVVNPRSGSARVTTNNPWISMSPNPFDATPYETLPIVEGAAQVITLTLHSGGDVRRSIKWSTLQTGSAVSQTDYTEVHEWGVHWEVGETTKTITIQRVAQARPSHARALPSQGRGAKVSEAPSTGVPSAVRTRHADPVCDSSLDVEPRASDDWSALADPCATAGDRRSTASPRATRTHRHSAQRTLRSTGVDAPDGRVGWILNA